MSTDNPHQADVDTDGDDEHVPVHNPGMAPIPLTGVLPSEFAGGPDNMPGSQKPPRAASEIDPEPIEVYPDAEVE